MRVVPRTGIEPVRSFQPEILSLLRLPIPPPRHEDVPNVQIGTWHVNLPAQTCGYGRGFPPIYLGETPSPENTAWP